MTPATENTLWPQLSYDQWKDTLETLHMWMQIVGKVKLELSPFLNQWWEVTFQASAYGMTTGRIPYASSLFQVDFDFLTHILLIRTSSNKLKTITLAPRSVADFYREFMQLLKALDINISIYPIPIEVSHPIPFAKDQLHHAYDKNAVSRWWNVIMQTSLVFDRFRSSFQGKSSPIHFFWGSFDLNGTRFSGKPARPPKMKGAMGKIMRFAENEENFAFGFWPGDERYPHPAYYSYVHPAPKGIEKIDFGPGATFNEQLSECLLPYETVRTSRDPSRMLLDFLENSYTLSTNLAGWDRRSLQGPIPAYV